MFQVTLTARNFLRFRIAIVGRAAFQNITDVHFFSLHPDSFDDLVEKLSGFPDKRLALGIFIGARSLTDEHDVGTRAANSEDEIRARISEGTLDTRADIFVEFLQRFQLRPRLIGMPESAGGVRIALFIVFHIDDVSKQILLLHEVSLYVSQKVGELFIQI